MECERAVLALYCTVCVRFLCLLCVSVARVVFVNCVFISGH